MKQRITVTTSALILISLLLCNLAISYEYRSNNQSPLKAEEHIKSLINSMEEHPQYSLQGNTIYSREMLGRFYNKRNFYPAWNDNDNPSEKIENLIKSIEDADSHGLIPEYYHLDAIKKLITQTHNGHKSVSEPASKHIAKLDLLLTDAFLTLGCHFSGGCVTPLTTEAEWHASGGNSDIDLFLETALKENKIRETLDQLLPQQEDYSRLRDTLPLYRKMVARGGWHSVQENTLLMKGDKSYQVRDIKNRFIALGDLKLDKSDDEEVFDKKLERSIIRFQKRHGLNADGVIGPLTLHAMNVPATTRLRQIELNLERMRWTSGNLAHRYIKINIADFKLSVIEHGRSILSMNVIVGKPYWHTPVLSELMTYTVFNPTWKIPESILKEELLPKVIANPSYLAERDISILSSWADNANKIDPSTISWPNVEEDNFPYRMRQEPGPLNPLGNIKFIFPNRFNVYLHDTPGKSHFSKKIRSFSHGCIRISKPVDLAEYLLQNNPKWTRGKILTAIKSRRTQAVTLPEAIQIHILYLTAWVDEQGTLQFRNDIYGRDERLYKALLQEAPRLTSASKLTFIIR